MESVFEVFLEGLRKGITPNPDVLCNREIKFGPFLKKAFDIGGDYVATGHYARVNNSHSREGVAALDADGVGFSLLKGIDESKDQSYFLCGLSQEQLARVIFPIGGLLKSQVREIAIESGFVNAGKSESQDICFIPDGDYFEYIVKYTGETPQKGRFVDTDGNFLGESKGVSSYTLGQRRGLGLAMPHPPYVVEIRPDDNTVVIGKEDMLYSKTLKAEKLNFIPFDRLDSPFKALVKIRYSDPGHPAVVRRTGEDTVYIEFDEPQRAITKGQAAVIYDGNTVIGGGTII